MKITVDKKIDRELAPGEFPIPIDASNKAYSIANLASYLIPAKYWDIIEVIKVNIVCMVLWKRLLKH